MTEWIRIERQISKIIIWIVDIKRDMLIEMNWIQKTSTIVTKKEIEFNVLENKISEWLKDLRKVFREILKKELSFYYNEVNYEIILKIEKIKSLLLIPI